MTSTPPLLLAVPNLSEGSDGPTLERIAAAFAPARLLDLHADPDHGRAVLSMAAHQGDLAHALVAGVARAVELLDIRRHTGAHPRVGAVDVAPVVFARAEDRGAACAEALTAAALIGDELEVPVFLYGALATAPGQVERADMRRGGPGEVARRIGTGELVPDHGPRRAHPSAGAVLITARAPLVAFNLELASGGADPAEALDAAKAVAARLRESGGGPPGARALGLWLASRGVAQVSMNVEEPTAGALAELVQLARRHAEVAAAEIVGLAPAAALDGFPADVPLRGFEPERQLLENALRSLV